MHKITLPRMLKHQMFEHAVTSPEQEICGLIGGSKGHPETYYPIKNVADDPVRSYLMDPQEQINAMRDMRNLGESIIGIFHSHPFTSADPSAADLELAAYPDVIYFIISLIGAKPELSTYYFDGKSFSKIPTLITKN